MKLFKTLTQLSWLSLGLFLALATGCRYSDIFGPYMSGPYSASQIPTRLAEMHDTVARYTPKSESQAAELTTTFYYYDDGSTSYLLSVFYPKKTDSQANRIAVLRTSLLSPTMYGAINANDKVAINWQNQIILAYVCEFTGGTVYHDSFPGDPYQTCLYWESQRYYFLFYSSLSLDNTLSLVNSLEQVK